MTVAQLNSKLTSSLKKFIKNEKFVDSGDLYKSIKFNCTYTNELNIKLNSKEYIQYLDNGDLLNNFFNLESTKNLVAEFLVSQIDLEF
jgi:hypothetical protein